MHGVLKQPLYAKNFMKDYSLIDKFIVASDVSDRDGIGVEIYVKDQLVLEIFRDDTKKTREISQYKNDLPLELIEQSIELFKKEIPWDFIDYGEFE